MPYVLVYDIGTTAVKSALVDLETLKVTRSASTPVPMKYPSFREAVMNPGELWRAVVETSREIAGAEVLRPEAVTIISQMAGVLPVDSEMRPLTDIMTWLDERAAGYPKSLFSGVLKMSGYNLFHILRFLRITGGAPSKTGKDPISKILWLKHEAPEIWSKAKKILDVKGYLLYRMTGSIVTTTDEANLSWLMDTRKGKHGWSTSILSRYGIPRELLPEIVEPTKVVGTLQSEASEQLKVREGTPVAAGAGDVVGVASGSGMTRLGEAHIYIGTSNWLAAHVDKRLLDISHYMGSLISAIPGRYLFIAEQEVAAGALEWMLDRLKCGDGDERYECMKKHIMDTPPGSGGVLFAPWMYGERSPIDDEHVRGVLLNLSLSHGDGHLIRSVVEGVAFNIRFAYEYFRKRVPPLGGVNIVGGGALLDEWCQIISDLIGLEVRRTIQPRMVGARGGAVIAGVGIGSYSSFDEASKLVTVERVFTPVADRSVYYNDRFNYYLGIYKSLRKLFKEMNKNPMGQ
ncbi:MAG: FGGY-family carbohydrate kinase [Desulfurococcales archaeon]|nr:FGGY-family carbohydrate kinase [Desulfurococcales archaeon]